MTVLKPECITKHTKRTFVIEEHRSQVRFLNPNKHEVQEIKVDDCVLTEGQRCDYLVIVDQADVSVLVELKGSDVKHAIDQLTRSHKVLVEHCKTNKFWIISSYRCPLASTEIQSLTIRIRRDWGVKLKIKNSPVEHTF